MNTSPEHFNQLYDKYFERFFAFILYRVKTREDAEDLNAVLWERVVKNLKNIGEKPGQFEAWCFRTARNLVIDFYRTNDKRRGDVSLELAFSVKDHVDVEGGVKARNDLQKLFDLVEKLPEQQKEAFRLRYFDGLSNKEIAKLMRVGEKTVAANLSRAKKYLREVFSKCSNYLAVLVLVIVMFKK